MKELGLKNLLLGYTLTMLAALVAVAIGWLCQRLFHLKTLYSRKITHILLFGVLPVAHCFLGYSYHIAVLTFISLVINVLSWRFHIFRSIEDDSLHSFGTVLYSITIFACAILLWRLPHLYTRIVCCYAVLSFGDGFAAIVGAAIPLKFKLAGNKTLFGSAAMFLCSLASVATCNTVCGFGLSVLAVLAVAAAVTIAELFPYGGLDNITIPLVGIGMLTLLSQGVLAWPVLLAILVGLALAWLLPLRAYTPPAAFVMVASMVVIAYSMSIEGLVLSIIPFAVLAAVRAAMPRGMGAAGIWPAVRAPWMLCKAVPMAVCAFVVIWVPSDWLRIGLTLCAALAVADTLAAYLGRMAHRVPSDIRIYRPYASVGCGVLNWLCCAYGVWALLLTVLSLA